MKINRKFMGVSSLSLAIMCGFGLTFSSTSYALDEALKLGVLAGEDDVMGQNIINAAELAVNEINEAGGVNGQKIELFKYNTRDSSVEAGLAMQRAAQRDGVHGTLGIFDSGVALSTMPWAKRLKMPFIVTGAISTDISKRVGQDPEGLKYVFHGAPNTTLTTKASCDAIKYLQDNDDSLKNFKRAAIMVEDAAWTELIVEEYKSCVPDIGLDLVDTIKFATNTDDFTPLYSRLKSNNVDIIFAATSFVGVAAIKQWHSQEIPMLFTGLNTEPTTSSFWDQTNGATEGVITTFVPSARLPFTEKTIPFYDAYSAKYKHTPSYAAYSSYDAVYAYKHAVEKMDSTENDKIVEGLRQVDFIGTIGKYKYYGMDGEFPQEVIVTDDPETGYILTTQQWQDGKQVVIYPDMDNKVMIPDFVKK